MPKPSENQKPGNKPEHREAKGGRQQRTTSPNADKDNAAKQGPKGPGREESTGGSQSPRQDDKRSDKANQNNRNMEAERGYQSRAGTEETKNDPNRPW